MKTKKKRIRFKPGQLAARLSLHNAIMDECRKREKANGLLMDCAKAVDPVNYIHIFQYLVDMYRPEYSNHSMIPANLTFRDVKQRASLLPSKPNGLARHSISFAPSNYSTHVSEVQRTPS